MRCFSYRARALRHSAFLAIVLGLVSPASGQTVSQMVDGGVSYLLNHMVDDPADADIFPDYWPPQVFENDEPAALVPFCAEALLAAPGYDQSQARKDAVARATRFLLDHHLSYAGFPKIQALHYLLRLQASARVPCGMEVEVKEETQNYVNGVRLDLCCSPSSLQTGIAYSGSDNGQASFYTAPALLYLKEAYDLGYSPDPAAPACVDRCSDFLNESLDNLSRARILVSNNQPGPNGENLGPHEGAFTYQSIRDDPARPYFANRATIPGSLSRMPICEAALLAWDEPPNATDANLRGALNKFFDGTTLYRAHDGVTGVVSKTAYNWLLGQKGQGGHTGYYEMADYYFMYAHFSAALAIEHLPEEERPALRDGLAQLLRNVREVDGSWSDQQTPTKNYGTAMAILALTAAGADPAGGEIRGKIANDALNNSSTTGPALAGWTVCLQSASQGLHLHRTTDAAGAYVFDDLPAGGKYTVTPLGLPGWVQTFPPATNRLGILRGSWKGSELQYNDVCSWGEFAFLAASGIDILKVSEPCAPKHLYSWFPTGSCVAFEDVKASNGIGFFASYACGVVIADLHTLRDNPPSPPDELSRINATTFPGLGSNRVTGLSVEGSLLFLADGISGAVKVFDVSLPASPRYIDSIEATSDGPVRDVFVRSPFLFLGDSENNATGGVDVIDIRDLTKPEVLSRVSLKAAASVWATETGRQFYVAQRRPEIAGDPSQQYGVTLWDLDDAHTPEDCLPELSSTLPSPPIQPLQTTWSPFSVVADGNLLYAAWCQAGAFVFDVTDADEPCQAANSAFYAGVFAQNPCSAGKYPLGHFDTYCPLPEAEFNGARSIDPFLGPDRILVADSLNGLSVLSSAGRSYELVVQTQPLLNQNFAFHRPPAEQALLSAQFQPGALPAGWTKTGLWDATAACPRSSGECAPGGWAYFGNDADCNFNSGTVSGVLSAPPVTIPSHAVSATLRYCSAYQGESGDSNVSGRDWAWVAVNGTEVDDVSLSQTHLNWKTRSVDLGAYIGQTITLTWHFDSRNGVSNFGIGWQVAEIEVEADMDPTSEDPATITGTVFNDLDGDGVRDAGEPGLSGRTVFLDRDADGQLDAGELSELTDSAGQYALTDLNPSTYTVAEVVPPGWSQTAPLNLLGEKRGHWHGSAEYADIWAEGNIAFVGHFGFQGVDIIDVSNPTNPQHLATWNHNPPAPHAADIKTKDGIAYIASDGAGVFVVDVRNPSNPRTLKRIRSTANPAEGTLGGGFDMTHNVYIEGNYLYMCNSDPAADDTRIRIFNISNPCNPYALNIPPLPADRPLDVDSPNIHIHGASHEDRRIHDITVKNGKLFACETGTVGRVYVFNVLNLELDPGKLNAPYLGSILTNHNTHSCWPTDLGDYLVVTREPSPNGQVSGSVLGNEVDIWDISALGWDMDGGEPPPPSARAQRISLPTTEAFSAHHPRIVGDLLYLSWYEAGVLVFDLRNPLQPVQLGRYDTYLCDTFTGCGYDPDCYTGAWGVYPFLGPDRILVTDTETGLYVLGPKKTHTVKLAAGEVVAAKDFGTKSTPAPSPPGNVAFVKAGATGANNGTSWTNAYTSLAQALSSSSATEFWVAAGTYLPGTSRANSFVIPSGKSVYGGFNGTEYARNQRNIVLSTCILSGALYNNYHVVKAVGTSYTTILDGFTVIGGNADGINDDGYGGGFFINGSLAVRNCRILGNRGNFGGGAYAKSGSSTFANCAFGGNTGVYTGGGYYGHTGDASTITNCSFTLNHAGYWGGGVGGTSGGSLTIRNCIVYGNTGYGNPEQNQVYSTASLTVGNTCIQGLTAFSGNGNISGNPLFMDADGADNVKGTIDDNLRIPATSPCKNAGDGSYISEPKDLDFKPRVMECSVDMGAYEV